MRRGVRRFALVSSLLLVPASLVACAPAQKPPVPIVLSIRATIDLPDTVTGFQIKPIYVVPSDGIDHSSDIDGRIAGLLDAGNVYLKQQIGQTLPIDRTSTGYDIQFMRSKKSTAALTKQKISPSDLLIESKVLNTPGANRKDYVFFIDVDSFKSNSTVGSDACGFGNMPGIAAIVAIAGKLCSQRTNTFSDFVTLSWIHEVIHNFGVGHVPTACDLMQAKTVCASGQKTSLDAKRNLYVTSDKYGQDIMKLRVWKGYTARQSLQANCWLGTRVPRPDGIKYVLCPTGSQTIGALTNCWTKITSVTLQENQNGKWMSLGTGSHFYQPWGSRLTWKCNTGWSAPWKKLTVLKPGLKHYRWMVNGKISEYLNVIWVQ
ncbi:MAG TPA: hypothetical protein VF307_08715 [Candidatus Nanopelagicaceae bacterium]